MRERSDVSMLSSELRTESRSNVPMSRFAGKKVHFIGIAGCGMAGLARMLLDAGAAVLLDDLRDAKENAAKLLPLLGPLIQDCERRQTMAQAARKLGKPDAADAVARVITGLI